jgi:hypothetical protein
MPAPQPPLVGVKNTLINIARADKQLFHIIEYTQNVPKVSAKSLAGQPTTPNTAQQLTQARTPFTSQWYFDDTFVCMNSEVQEWLNSVSTTLKYLYDGESEQGTVSVLIALIQYAAIYENKDRNGELIFNPSGQGGSEDDYSILGLIAEAMVDKFDPTVWKPLKALIVEKIHDNSWNDTYFLGHRCTRIDPQPWQYLIIVTMKRKLVRGFARDETPPGTVQEAVIAAYKDSMLILHGICNVAASASSPPNKNYTDLMHVFDNNLLPDGTGGLILELQHTLVDVVREWYTWFLVQRAFGRRISSVITQYIDKKDDASRRVWIDLEDIEKKWIDASLIESTGEFNVAQFADQCRMSTDKNNRLSDFLEGCGSIPFFKDITTKMETMCNASSGWDRLVYAERSGRSLRIDVTALGMFLKSLFAAFGIEFGTKPRIYGITPSIPWPRQPRFRCEDFRTFRARGRGVGNSVVIAGVDVRTADLAVVQTNWSLGTRGGVASSLSGSSLSEYYDFDEDPGSPSTDRDPGSPSTDRDPVDHWNDFDGRIRNFRAAYVKYNSRNDVGPNGSFQPEEYKQQCEEQLDNLIHKNLGIRHKTDKTHISTDICTFLRHLESPQTYQIALGLVVGILSKNYSSMSSITKMRQLSNTPKNWEGFSDQFDFFISLLLASLLYDMGDAGDGNSVLDIELRRYEMDQSVGLEWLKDRASESLTDTECRLYLYRGICWKWIEKIFNPHTGSDEPIPSHRQKERYTIHDMLNLIWKARTTSEPKSQYRTIKSYENKIYSWKRDGYDILTNEKNVVEHTLCVILVVAGVDNLKASVMYDGIHPPPLEGAVEDTTEPQIPEPTPEEEPPIRPYAKPGL